MLPTSELRVRPAESKSTGGLFLVVTNGSKAAVAADVSEVITLCLLVHDWCLLHHLSRLITAIDAENTLFGVLVIELYPQGRAEMLNV